MNQLYDVIIAGGGPAGLSAAIYLARAKYRVLVVEKEKIGGQITITAEVVNYPGVPVTDGEKLTQNMREQAEHFGAEFMLAEISRLDVEEDIKTVHTDKGSLKTLGIVLATGASPRKLGFKGEHEFRGRGVAYCATCDGEFFTGKDIFVIGGGFAAAEEAVFLTKYAKTVRVMVRGDHFTCAKTVADEALNHPGITVEFNTEIVEIGGAGKLEYARFYNNKTAAAWEYKSTEGFGVFVFAGYEPANVLFKDILECNEQGYLITDINQKTNIDGVYGAGDICVKNLRQVVTAVSDGAVAATSLEKFVSAQYEKLKLPKRENRQTAPVGKTPAAAGKKQDAGAESGTFITAAMEQQLTALFQRFERKILLKLSLDERPVSREAEALIREVAALSDQILVQTETAKGQGDAPAIRFCDEKGDALGTAFHGVPGGHEFNSFVIALYNAAGPGQALEAGLTKRIKGLQKKVKIQVVVSLSCTQCPDLVMAVQRIALESGAVTADIYDLAHFPELKERYGIMSVPCMIVNEQDVYFGKKNIAQIADILEK